MKRVVTMRMMEGRSSDRDGDDDGLGHGGLSSAGAGDMEDLLQVDGRNKPKVSGSANPAAIKTTITFD